MALKKGISDLSPAWSGTLVIFVFNIFDGFGKFFAKFRRFYSLLSTVVLVLLRCAFYATFILVATQNDMPVFCTDWFLIINVALFAFTNGYCTSCIMVLTPEQVGSTEKETAGFLISFPLMLGFFSGGLLALPFVNL